MVKSEMIKGKMTRKKCKNGKKMAVLLPVCYLHKEKYCFNIDNQIVRQFTIVSWNETFKRKMKNVIRNF